MLVLVIESIVLCLAFTLMVFFMSRDGMWLFLTSYGSATIPIS